MTTQNYGTRAGARATLEEKLIVHGCHTARASKKGERVGTDTAGSGGAQGRKGEDPQMVIPFDVLQTILAA